MGRGIAGGGSSRVHPTAQVRAAETSGNSILKTLSYLLLAVLLPASLANADVKRRRPSVPAGTTATTTSTEPVGFRTTTCLANSDTYVALPFNRPNVFTGPVQSASGSTITVSGAPWAASQFVYGGTQRNRYYVLIGSGGTSNTKEGRSYAVASNSTNSLTLDTTEDLSAITANTSIQVIPYWTPATVFPAADANTSFTPTTSSSSYQTQIRVPSPTAAANNSTPAAIYFYSNNVDGTGSNVGWRQAGDNFTSHDDDALLPDSYFVVRNANGAPAGSLTLNGTVPGTKVQVPLVASTAAQDNAVGMVRPVGVALNAIGLKQTDGTMLPDDRLLLFDNSVAAFNKTPRSYYFGAGWRLEGDPTTDRGDELVPAGSAMIVRKAAISTSKSFAWVNSPTYGLATLDALQAVSRHAQDTTSFDIDMPLAGTTHGIESRRVGSNGAHSVVVTFLVPVTYTTAGVGSGSANLASVSGNGTTAITFNLTNVTNAQHLTLNLNGVSDGQKSNNIAVPVDVLIGDTNNDSSVDAGDIAQTKSQSGSLVTVANFRQDVNGDGSIDAGDIGLVKSMSGTGL
jgi:uncharacterized protein (TIGR02597 family)